MRRQLIPALRLVLLLTVVLGLAYPLAMTGVAQALFPSQADGSLVERHGVVVGSTLVGQAFSGPEYFHGRPSAAGALAAGTPVQDVDASGHPVGAPHPADPRDLSIAATGASNQGPTNADLLAAIEERAAAYRKTNGLSDDVPVPIDAVTASASGVDPHMSVANARLQGRRVAERRGLDLQLVLRAIDDHTDQRPFGFLGEPGVNVLALNLALDELSA